MKKPASTGNQGIDGTSKNAKKTQIYKLFSYKIFGKYGAFLRQKFANIRILFIVIYGNLTPYP